MNQEPERKSPGNNGGLKMLSRALEELSARTRRSSCMGEELDEIGHRKMEIFRKLPHPADGVAEVE
jgi:hypothetical protein